MKKHKLKKIIEFTPAYDKRSPDPSKNYGIHGMEIHFVLKGELGAVNFAIFTNWYLPEVQRELYRRNRLNVRHETGGIEPWGTDIGYHSPKPMYEGHSVTAEDCGYLDGKPCYYDGSSLRADEFIPEFLAGGDEAVWKMLEDEYKYRFEEKRKEET